MRFTLWRTLTNCDTLALLDEQDFEQYIYPLVAEIAWQVQARPLSCKLEGRSFELFFVAHPEQIKAFRRLFIPRLLELLGELFPRELHNPFSEVYSINEIAANRLEKELEERGLKLGVVFSSSCFAPFVSNLVISNQAQAQAP